MTDAQAEVRGPQAGTSPEYGGRWQRLWRRVPILHRILGANAAIIVIGALGGTLIAVRHGAAHPSSPHYELIAGFLLAGIAASVLANFVVLRAVLRPLDHLQRAVEAVRTGATGVRVQRNGLWDERLEHLADAFDGMVAVLDAQTERLRRLPGQILRAQEEERRRIARELHDEAAQALTSLLVRLRLLEQTDEPTQVRARVRELRALTARALDDVRRIAVELRPSVLDDLGLAAALAAHADALNASGETRVTVTAGLNGRGHAQERYLFPVLKAGAAGYVNKTAADVELITAIRTVAAGGAYLHPAAARALLGDFVARVRAGEEQDSYDRLSEREREVLKLVAEGYTTREIAERLFLSPKSVETYRARILEKLELRTRAELVRYALRRGLLLEEV